jgi:hypothetical protein
MPLLIYLTSALIVLSKFLDCYTTSAQIVSIHQERNPLARLIMKRLGVRFTIWVIFVLALGIVGISTWSLFCCYTGIGYRLGYIGIGAFIAWVQFSVAHTNRTSRINFVTRFLLGKVYRAK